MHSGLPIQRSFVLALLLAWLLQLSTSSLSWAGTFTFAGDSNGADVVTHPMGYTGTGGTLTVSVCIDSSSPDAANMEIPVRNIVANWNARVPTKGNLVSGAASELSSSEFDFESVALHEVGHCIGLDHTNAATESGLSGKHRNHTRAADGPNGSFDLDAGADGVIGSADDVRGDDVNLHWFRTATNDPFTIDSVIDSTTYSQDLADLPVGDLFPANADRSVANLLGVGNSEAVMQQGTFSGESQRTLVHDDIATLRFAMSGLNEIEGDSDDYDLVLDYIGQAASCDIKIGFDDAETGFAVCKTTGVFLNADHIRISSAKVYFNTGFNWYFNSSLLECGDGVLDAGEACDDGNQLDGDCCSSACTFEAAGSVCDDASACTETDVCDGGGSCTGALVVCDNGLFCDGEETCDPATGCQSGTPVGVDDGVSCTEDSCDETLDVVLNVVNDANCENGLFCDGSEFCDATLGCQAGTPVGADDGVFCTEDSCDEVSEVVVNAANDANCDDFNDCTADSCDAVLGCAHETIEGCEIPVDATGPASRFVLYALMVLLGTIGAGAVARGPGDDHA